MPFSPLHNLYVAPCSITTRWPRELCLEGTTLIPSCFCALVKHNPHPPWDIWGNWHWLVSNRKNASPHGAIVCPQNKVWYHYIPYVYCQTLWNPHPMRQHVCSIGFFSTTMSQGGGGEGSWGLRLTCALGSSRKYPYTYHGWHWNFTTPCVQKFQNALTPPPPLARIRNSRLLYPSFLSEFQRCFRPLQNFLFNPLTTQKSFFSAS